MPEIINLGLPFRVFRCRAPDFFSWRACNKATCGAQNSMSGVFTLSVECRLSASHVLSGCPPCDRLHGHTWRVRANWVFSGLNGEGKGTDFHVLREVLERAVRQRYDHRHLNDIPPFDKNPPTAENLAREIFRQLKADPIQGPDGRLARVEVWEGPDACAGYEE